MGYLHFRSAGVPIHCRRGPGAAARFRDACARVLPAALFLLFFAGSSSALELPAGIIGGTTAAPGAWPWQVSIGASTMAPYAGHFCGGVLVSTRWVVTVAHCVVDAAGAPVDPAGITITMGTNDLLSGGVQAGVTSIVVNPSFDQATFDNDIALLHLDRDANCGDCNPIPFVTPETEAGVAAPGTDATVTGWGVTSVNATTIPSQLQEVQVPIVDNATCISAYGGGRITSRMICAGTMGKDSCQGDSGGPLVVHNSAGNGYLLAGLVSFGESCAAPGFPGVYTRASSFSSWVNATVSGSSGGGGGGGDASALLPLLCAVALRGLLRRREFRRRVGRN